MKKVLTIIGTRPEAIKMAILVQKLNANPNLEHKLCITGQHREMLDSVLSFFQIDADFDLKIMKPGQDLTDVTANILTGLRDLFTRYKPDLVLVHGDTSTCMAATLAAYYSKIPVGHVEAGLRTYNLHSPFPEEGNRLITDHIASMHFVPTEKNRLNLIKEGIKESTIQITGNTVIDSLLYASQNISSFSDQIPTQIIRIFEEKRKVLLVTGHRRENFGDGFLQICAALKNLSEMLPELNIVYPVHLNPNVQIPVQDLLKNLPNVFLVAPFNYPDFVFAMKNCWAILTDSGGVQEEAPSLGKPVLVMRDTTERPEALEAGSVRLVGANATSIKDGITELWNNVAVYDSMAKGLNPYGDGKAADRILDAILHELTNNHPRDLKLQLQPTNL